MSFIHWQTRRREGSWTSIGTVLGLLVLGLSICHGSAAAQWIDNGVNLCNEPANQDFASITTDGAGGTIVAWRDSRVGAAGIYAQRVGATGGLEWAANGALAYAAASGHNPQTPNLTSDGAGGAIIFWHDYVGATDIFAQRVDDTGAAMWGANGVPICTAANYQFWPVGIEDGAGGAIIVWKDARSGIYDLYAQRVDADGNVLWASDGVPLCTAAGAQDSYDLIPDGAGGAVVVWYDERGTSPDIYAQRIDSLGNPVWATDGVPVCTSPGYQGAPKIVSDGSGGSIIAWHDSRSSPSHIYAQRLDANGRTLWAANGVRACPKNTYQSYPDLVADGVGGAVVVWEDDRASPWFDSIFAQRLDLSGSLLWGAAGVQATLNPTGAQMLPQVATDGQQGAIVSWHLANYGGNIEAQRFGAHGGRLWGDSGVKICGVPGGMQTVRAESDGAGGAIVVWRDERDTDRDVRAQQVDPNGCTGYLPAQILSVDDVPADQGGKVRVTFRRSNGDRPEVWASPISMYTVWQRIDVAALPVTLQQGSIGEEQIDVEGVPAVKWQGRSLHLATTAGSGCATFPPGTWEAVLSVGATGQPSYVGRVSTVQDSSAAGPGESVFVVTTHSSSAAWYISAPDSGYSVDNIPPSVPTGLAAAYHTGGGNRLLWDPSPDQDFEYFRVYRDVDPNFVPGPQTLVDATLVPRWTDPVYDNESVFYQVSAVDHAGNESPPAQPGIVTAADDVPDSRAALHPNVPNPFNPATTISYEVPVGGGEVRLTVYDTTGRIVKTLVHREESEGTHRARWNGRDDAGAEIGAGVYFCRLEIGDFHATRKLVLVK